ncbi:MAG: LysR family transcriptional regulator [Geminicoccaceae bacterium]
MAALEAERLPWSMTRNRDGSFGQHSAHCVTGDFRCWTGIGARIFHVVAGAGSFTRAADRLGLSQSAISRQIGALEEDLGVALFHRHARSPAHRSMARDPAGDGNSRRPAHGQ